MTNRIVWILVSCLIATSLLVVSVSCSNASKETGSATTSSGAPDTKSAALAPTSPSASNSASAEMPKYGGVLNGYMINSPSGFDQGPGALAFSQFSLRLTNDEVMIEDWSKGPAGTNEFTYIYGFNVNLNSKTGSLAESWKILEPGHWVFKVRPGVHYALNQNSEASRLVNGRELTADDIVFSFNRLNKKNNYIRSAASHMVDNTSVTAPDKYTVDVKSSPEDTLWVLTYLALNCSIIPPELDAKYGDINDWHNSVGTGPFMLTDFTSGSSMTFVKNPNYWAKDPVGPGKGNQLPYMDGIKMLVLPDPSTRLTAMRTGKIDMLGQGDTFGLVKDDYANLTSTTSQLKSARSLASSSWVIYMRTDKQDLPFKDIKVRQALTMAVDYKSIVDKLMQGDAEYPGFPMPSIQDFKSIYIPLKEAPQAVQDLYTYNPTKAKQLLTEAGYPNGFSATISVDSTGGIYTDQVALIKDAWSKIGVNLTIKPMDNSSFNKESASRSYDQMSYGSAGNRATYIRMISWDGGTQYNGSYVNDPKAKQVARDINMAMAAGDQTKADSLYKDFEKYAMEQAWMIPYPTAYSYTVWWPWLKNYHGETGLSFGGLYSWTKWAWIDQDLKKSMGY